MFTSGSVCGSCAIGERLYRGAQLCKGAAASSSTKMLASKPLVAVRARGRPDAVRMTAPISGMRATARAAILRRASQSEDPSSASSGAAAASSAPIDPLVSERVKARAAARRRERITYQASAIAATLGVGALAVGATYYRFWMHVADGAPFPWLDMGCTLALVVGGAVGMEMWARFAHKALWHDFQPGWALHKSHHEPRVGPFEANDVFAIVNAVPAMGLCLYGFLTPSLPGSLCFGAGLGITLFGISYMFVHDGLVHRRFPVGPLAEVPAMKRIVAAHKLHHSERYNGVPWGLFLGPQELEAIGAGADLDKLVAEMEGAGSSASTTASVSISSGNGGAGSAAAAPVPARR